MRSFRREDGSARDSADSGWWRTSGHMTRRFIAGSSRPGPTWRACRGLVGVLVVLGVVLVVPVGAAAAGPRLPALVFAGSGGVVWRDLRAGLGGRLVVRRETRARLDADRRYGLVVFDGDRLAARALAGDRRALRDYLDGGGWVLALDASSADFARVLDGLTGFSARPVHGSAGASVFMFREAVVRGVPTVEMLDAPSLVPSGAFGLSAGARRAAIAGQARRLAQMIATRLQHPDTGTGHPNQAQDIPPEALHAAWTYTQTGSAVPPAAYWVANRDRAPAGIAPPPAGQQTASWTVNQQFAAYLDNSAVHPEGNYQIVTYDLDGEFTPKEPSQKFQFMDDQFKVGAAFYDLERSWWTGYVASAVTPDAAATGKLIWEASQPATPNEEGTYTSGQKFEVGVTVTHEGPGVSGSYSVSSEQEHSVPDWGVTNETAGDDLGWLFSARDHCNVTPDSYTVDGCFNWGAFQDGTPVRPNDLSRGQLQFAASGRWRTKQLLTGDQGRLTFKVATPVTMADTVCEDWSVATCDRHVSGSAHLSRFGTGPPETDYTVDVADVVPVGVAAINLTPNPADGSTNQKVTGTVVLKAPTPLPLTIKLFSDDANATLPLPLGNGVSQDTVTIPAHQNSATFTINTNANGLDKGEVETVDITAFYTAPTTTQLHVRATS
jgi:hypothetical protein